jgi:hypothetical protein
MKWLLVIVLWNTPVPTNLVFDTLPACWAAGDQYQREVLVVVNQDLAAFRQSDQAKGMGAQGMNNAILGFANRAGVATCIPHR